MNHPNLWPKEIKLSKFVAMHCSMSVDCKLMRIQQIKIGDEKKPRAKVKATTHCQLNGRVCVCELECHYHRCWCVSSSFMRINQVAMMWLTFVKWKYSFSPTCYSNRFHTVDMRFGFTYHMHYSICWNEIRC